MFLKKFTQYWNLNLLSNKLFIVNSPIYLSILKKSAMYLVHKDILRQFNQKFYKMNSTKTRSEVRGGGIKPRQQKGTGKARAGSNRSPLWKGGGVIFGPKFRKISYKLNKKERKLAIYTLFYNMRFNIFVVKNLEDFLINSKTRNFLSIFQNFQINLQTKLLIIVKDKTEFLKNATRNMNNIELISASHLNTLSLLKSKHIILTTSAIQEINNYFL
uniref:Large ribosomal subunit protein uL4c n=1 Tax=Astrosyne radiata TaxID=1158023 RepID=A0A2U9NTF3_9STRA|nr:ribosomal protein L4 [Astrosyne radiata]AWT40349.1 ribosomal protein L4 [Astrosyne radiata]